MSIYEGVTVNALSGAPPSSSMAAFNPVKTVRSVFHTTPLDSRLYAGNNLTTSSTGASPATARAY